MAGIPKFTTHAAGRKDRGPAVKHDAPGVHRRQERVRRPAGDEARQQSSAAGVLLVAVSVHCDEVRSCVDGEREFECRLRPEQIVRFAKSDEVFGRSGDRGIPARRDVRARMFRELHETNVGIGLSSNGRERRARVATAVVHDNGQRRAQRQQRRDLAHPREFRAPRFILEQPARIRIGPIHRFEIIEGGQLRRVDRAHPPEAGAKAQPKRAKLPKPAAFDELQAPPHRADDALQGHDVRRGIVEIGRHLPAQCVSSRPAPRPAR